MLKNPKYNDKQLEAINHGNGPLLILAGAGSGKTSTLVGRIIHLLEQGTPPESILAITFTNKAAREIRERVKKVLHNKDPEIARNIFLGTFHSFGALLLRKLAPHARRTPSFTIYDSSDSEGLVKKILKELNLPENPSRKPAKVLGEFSRIKSRREESTDELINNLFKTYEERLERNNAFDFDDLIVKPIEILEREENLAARYHSLYDYILIDEFQDTNTAQYSLIRLLAGKGNVNVVGDDAQSIYGWRHADYRIFLNFESDWPGTKIVKLEENYRSTGTILKAANHLIGFNKFQKEKTLFTKNPEGKEIKVVIADGPESEADYIVGEIRNMVRDGESMQEIALLYRTNAQSRALEQALLGEGIPYQIFGGLKFYERMEIKDILAGLRLIANPTDSASFDRLEKNLGKRITKKVVGRLKEKSGADSPAPLINFFLEVSDYVQSLKTEKNALDRLENIQELIKYAEGKSDLVSFLEEVSLVQSVDDPSGSRLPGVNLLTIHLAKGLEFNRVFVVGCVDGILPHERSLSSHIDIEEERRLMYVAITRARHELVITIYGIPSRFLNELPQEVLSLQSLAPRRRFSDSRSFDDLEEDAWLSYDN
ncbi:MAG: ATP-dependent DNA helicase PcrA [Candidatus Harrisonbacteria bacterium]|nr:ATP-dependent DNA helicase PcrA [Candidatus Harrisonbacteria bacterium]